MRNLLALIALALFVGLASEASALDKGDAAPDIKFSQSWNGEQKSLSDFKGEVVLLNFWATW